MTEPSKRNSPGKKTLQKFKDAATRVVRKSIPRSGWSTPGIFTSAAGVLNQELELEVFRKAVFGDGDFDLESLLQKDLESAPPLDPVQRDPAVCLTVYRGDIQSKTAADAALAPPKQVVRFFVSSTFTDTVFERDCLVAFVAPRLRKLCHSRGLEFELSEMRWGINGALSETHQTRDVCMRELERCLRDSAATSFVGLVGDKYGFRPIPNRVKTLPSSVDKNDLLKKWYKWDENIGHYVLLPVTDVYPEYNSNVNDEHSELWWNDFEAMQALFDAEIPGRGLPSVTQEEMTKGIIQVVERATANGKQLLAANGSPLLVLRNFDTNDFVDPSYRDPDYAVPLGVLKTNLESALSSECVMKAETKWFKGGINPVLHKEHGSYLRTVMDDLYNRLKEGILAFRPQQKDSLMDEVRTHWLFAINRTSNGHVERPQLYSRIKEMTSKSPFSIVRGVSGTGKSTLLAQLALNPPKIDGVKPVVIVRFVPSTVESSTIAGLLRGICEQLSMVFPEALQDAPIPSDSVELAEEFKDTFLAAATNENPVMIVIDALDQLRGSQTLGWLPRGSTIPPHVKIVVSTLNPLHFAKEPFPEVNVPVLTEREATSQLVGALMAAQDPPRSLTAEQHDYLVDKFCSAEEPTFLYLRLLLDDSKQFRSFTPVPLPHWLQIVDVPSAVDSLFKRLRKSFGQVFVDKALSLLTYSRDGLSEAELNDLLSLDNDVLVSVFEWWVPPVPRVPPLMVTRLLEELKPYLTGQNIWFHRQFIEEATRQFAGYEAESLEHMIGYWNGKSESEQVTVTLKSGTKTKLARDRLVVNVHKERKVRELPVALLKRQKFKEFVMLMCNFQFLLDGIKAGYLTDMMQQILRFKEALEVLGENADHKQDQILSHEQLNEDLAAAEKEARKKAGMISFSKQKSRKSTSLLGTSKKEQSQLGDDIDVVYKLLSMGSIALRRNPEELASQILGRIPRDAESELLRNLCKEAFEFQPRHPWWRPLGPSLETAMTNSLLRFIRTGSEVRDVALTQDGSILATALKSNIIRLWDPNTGEPLPGREQPLVGHTGAITSLSFTTDGTLLLSGSSDRTARLWEVSTGEPASVGKNGVLKHPQRLTVTVFSPDGKHIVTGSGDRRIRMFDPVSGAPCGGARGAPLARHTGIVTDIVFHPNSQSFVSGGRDGLILVWSIPDDQSLPAVLIGEPMQNVGWVNALAIRPDGLMIAAAIRNGTVQLWDLETRKASQTKAGVRKTDGTLVGHQSSVTCVAFSSDGSTLASGSNDRTVILWDPDSGDVRSDRKDPLKGHTSTVSCLQFGPKGTLVSGSPDETVRIWNGGSLAADKSAQKLSSIQALAYGAHRAPVKSIAFSPDGRVIASGARDSFVRLWDAETGGVYSESGNLTGSSSSVSCVAYSPNGKFLAAASWDKRITIYNTSTLEVVEQLKGHTGTVSCIAFNSDSTLIASSSKDGSVRIWDVTTLKAKCDPLQGHAGWVNSVSFSPDGTTVVSAADDGNIIVWDTNTGTFKLGFEEPINGHEGRLKSVCVSPNGKMIAAGCSDGYVYLRNTENGGILFPPVKAHRASCNTVCFSPDNSYVVSGGSDRNLRYIDTSTGEYVNGKEAPIRAHRLPINCIVFNPAGNLMATCGDDGSIRFWNPKSGKIPTGREGSISKHGSKVKSLAVSNDGTKVASGSALGGIRLWNLKTGDQLNAFEGSMVGHTSAVYSMSFSPDDKYLASGSLDRTVRVWDVSSSTPKPRILKGHTAFVARVVYSTDGKELISMSSRETFVWDANSLELLRTEAGGSGSQSLRQITSSEDDTDNEASIKRGYLASPDRNGAGFSVDSDSIDNSAVSLPHAVVFELGKPHFLQLIGNSSGNKSS